MFAGCEKIIEINFVTFYSKNIRRMKYMLNGCKNLKNIKFSFDITDVSDMNHIFSECE